MSGPLNPGNAGFPATINIGSANQKILSPDQLIPTKISSAPLNIGEATERTLSPDKLIPPTHELMVGRDLTLWIFSIMAGSIMCLLLYLMWMDYTVANNLHDTYGKQITPDGIALYTAARIDGFSSDMAKATSSDGFALDPSAKAADASIIETLGYLPDMSAAQKDKLSGCLALIATTGVNRKDALSPCIALLDKTKNQGLAAASIQMADQSSTKLGEQREKLHDFWLKAAQLILLNLLLPVITAVIGYTFGNHQAQKQSS